jgi:tRNA (cmo5U34)-methyltransferase
VEHHRRHDEGHQWHFDPATYLERARSEIPEYDRWQDEVAHATSTVDARRILDLGSGTGLTAQRVLAQHPEASLVGIDASDEMLSRARDLLPAAEFLVRRLEEPLPDGPFDLVVSAFAIHHVDGDSKAALFRRIADVLTRGGRFVYCDVVVPDHPVANPIPLERDVDLPSTVSEQLGWLSDAGLRGSVVAAEDDIAVIAAEHVT